MLDSLENRIQNWARHWRIHLIKRPTPSLEGRYRPPRGAEIEWETEPAKAAPLPATDPFDAALLEDAWVCIPNRRAKDFLRLHHCQRRSWWFVKRRASLTGDYWENKLLADAALAIEIQRIEQSRQNTIRKARMLAVVELQFACA